MYKMNIIWLISIVKKPLMSIKQTLDWIDNRVLDYFLEIPTVVD